MNTMEHERISTMTAGDCLGGAAALEANAAQVALTRRGILPPAYAHELELALEQKNDALLALLVRAGAELPVRVLFCLVSAGMVETLRALVQLGKVNVNLADDEGRSLLHLAVEYNQPEILRVLLGVPGIYVNLRDKNGSTPLLRAAAAGFAECVRLLLSFSPQGGQPVDVNLQNHHHRTPLMAAVLYNRVSCVNLLVSAPGVDVNQPNAAGRTPLNTAAGLGYRQCVLALLSADGVEVNQPDHDRMTPLMRAVYREHRECVALLKLFAGETASLQEQAVRLALEALEHQEEVGWWQRLVNALRGWGARACAACRRLIGSRQKLAPVEGCPPWLEMIDDEEIKEIYKRSWSNERKRR